MATLETQYKNYLRDNPDSILSFEEWKEQLAEGIREALLRKDIQKKHLIDLTEMGQQESTQFPDEE